MSYGVVSAVAVAAWIGIAVCTPLYLLWRFGLHVLFEVAGVGCLIFWALLPEKAADVGDIRSS